MSGAAVALALIRPAYAPPVRSVLTTGVAILLASGSCVGIPVSRKTVNHIVATSWTADGRPVALAQKFRLGRTAYVGSPEGPGVFRDYDSGPLVLLLDRNEIPVHDGFDDSVIRVENAGSLPDGNGFVVILGISPGSDLRKSVWRCIEVAVDASIRPCAVPEGYKLEAFAYYLAPEAHELRFRRSSEGGSRFETLNFETGIVTAMGPDFKTLPLRWVGDTHWPSAPCDMSYSRLSPRGDRLAVACALAIAGGGRQGLWVMRPDGDPRLVFEFTDPTVRIPASEYRDVDTLEGMVTWPREEYGLSWSPDQEHLYWCGGRGSAGVLVSPEGGPTLERIPCLALTTWSPDGTRIVGVSQYEMNVWEVPAGPSNHARAR